MPSRAARPRPAPPNVGLSAAPRDPDCTAPGDRLTACHYRDLVLHATDAIYFCNRHFRLIDANEATCALFGYSRSELLGKHLTELIDPDDLRATPLRAEELHTGQPLRFDRVIRRKDGTHAHVEVNVRMLSSGVVQAVTRDVTERRRLERVIKENEQRLQLAARTVDMAVFNQDTDLRYTWVFRPQLGFDAANVIGRTDSELLPPADAARIMAIKRRVIEDGIPVREEVPVTRGSETSWFDLAVDPVRNDADVPVGLTGVSLDITARKRAEQAALGQLKLAETVFNHSVSCLAILDRDYNYVRVNAAYAAACRRKIEDFAGRNRFNLYPSPSARSIFDEVVRSKRPANVTGTEYVFADQPERGPTYWDWTLVPVLDSRGEVEYLVFSLSDVTLHMRAEMQARAARRQLRALSTRLLQIQEEERAHISRELHAEIGQALTAVKLQLQNLRQRERTNIEPLDECIRVIGATLEQVRDLSLNLRPPHIDHLGIAEALRWLLQQQARNAKWNIELIVDPLPQQLAPAIEIACFRIAQEALTNAARHAQAKNVTVRLSAAREQLELTVLDDGVGFDVDGITVSLERPTSLGLISITERAALVGGTVKFSRRESGGVEMTAVMPVHGQDSAKGCHSDGVGPNLTDRQGPTDQPSTIALPKTKF